MILVHGCFWHGHDCPMFKRPATRAKFWNTKIARNRERDCEAVAALRAAGSARSMVWECALRGPARLRLDDVIRRCEEFLKGPEWKDGRTRRALERHLILNPIRLAAEADRRSHAAHGPFSAIYLDLQKGVPTCALSLYNLVRPSGHHTTATQGYERSRIRSRVSAGSTAPRRIDRSPASGLGIRLQPP